MTQPRARVGGQIADDLPALAQVRLCERGQSIGIANLQVMTIRPRELVFIEHAGAMRDVLEAEAARKLVGGQQLFVLPGRPANQREIVDQGFRQISLLAELTNRGRAMTLRERRMIGPHHERQVRERRGLIPVRLVEKNLARRVRNVIFTADHVRHLHQRIVDDDGEVVGGNAVRADQHRVADHIGVKRNLAADDVVERDVTAFGHAKPDDRRFPVLFSATCFVERDVAAGAGVFRRQPRRKLRLTMRFERFSGAKAVIALDLPPAGDWCDRHTTACARSGDTDRRRRPPPRLRPTGGPSIADR